MISRRSVQLVRLRWVLATWVALGALAVSSAASAAAAVGTWVAKPHPVSPPERITERRRPRHVPDWIVYSRGIYGGSTYVPAAPPSPAPPAREQSASRSSYGPIIRRDGCTPKVYIIDPEDGSVESFCGQPNGPP
jgi:hypothetical protein